VTPWQVANYRSFAEQRAQQLGRTFDSLFDDVPAEGATCCTCTLLGASGQNPAAAAALAPWLMQLFPIVGGKLPPE
jgi:hypothetical protein